MTNIDKLTQHLFKLWDKKILPETLIIRLLALENNLRGDKLSEIFINSFLKRVLKRESFEVNLLGASSPHPDILILSPKKEYFNLDELDILQNFLSSKSLSLNKKLIIFPSAHALGQDEVANKLLKTLESPPIPATFLLVLSGSKKLLPTIEGRAIKFNVHLEHSTPAQISNFYQFFAMDLEKNNNLAADEAQELTAKLQSWANNKIDFNSFYNSFAKLEGADDALKRMAIDYTRSITLNSSSSPHDINLKKNILNILKDFEKAGVFNNSKVSRHAAFFHFLVGEQI